MGWNEGYTIFEATVVGAYDLGKLDEELLGVLMEPYRNTDIDSGGKAGLLTRDGKEVEQVAIETLGLEMPQKPTCPQYEWRPNPPPEEEASNAAWEAYHEAVYETFWRVAKRFGWRA